MNSKDTEDLLARRLAGEDVARGNRKSATSRFSPQVTPTAT